MQNHVEALKARHQALKEMIREEENRPNPDQVRTTVLKKEKLALKTRISSFEA